MSDRKNGDLQSKYEFHSAWADRIAFLIVVGLTVDIAAVFILEKSLLEAALAIVANVLIILGVWGELWFARRAREAGDGMVAEANARTAEANQKAQEAILELARLRAKQQSVDDVLLAVVRAGRDNALASEVTRSVTEAIAVSLGSVKRETTSEATRALYIVSKIEPFAGKKFDAVVTSIAINFGGLVGTLKSALKSAGWIEIEQSDPAAGIGLLSMDRAGGPALVRIDVDASKDPELLDAAGALASALNAEGIAATVNPKTDTDTTNVIHIRVGPKP
jgi:hypothetical protein